MAAVIKVLKNSELEAIIKVKSDSEGGTVKLTKEMLCYRPQPFTCVIDESDMKQRFEDVGDRSEIAILAMQWSGFSQEGAGRIYRGDTLDLEHQVASFCVGDTCQYEFLGDEMVSEHEYSRDDLTFELKGEVTVWVKLRKYRFVHYSGEYATYGAFEDDSQRGPYDRYNNSNKKP